MNDIAEIELAIQQLPERQIRQLLVRVENYLRHNNESQSDVLQTSSDDKIPTYDPDATPIWELAAKFAAEVPDEEWANVPTDLAERFDYYQAKAKNQEEIT